MTTQRILDVTLPLSPQNQVEYFKDKSILFRVDIPNSRITPKQCLMTLSNMRIKAEIKGVSPELLLEYMTGKFVTESTNLAKVCANIILGYKFQRMPYEDVAGDFSLDQYTDFIFDNSELLKDWINLIDSIPLYLAVCSQSFMDKEEGEEFKKHLVKIEGPLPTIGANLSQILALPEFLVLFNIGNDYADLLIHPYYTHYFDEYIYGGDRLISFLASDKYLAPFAGLSALAMKMVKENNILAEIKE